MAANRPLEAWEFFAGGGLAGLGLTGFEVAFANDIDPQKAAAFRANHPNTPFRLADVWSLDPAELPGRPDLVWASSPCQDLSLAGARAGLTARRSGAFWGFWRLVEGLAADGRPPGAVVLENVAGLLSSSGGADFAAICRAMADLGYRVGALEMDAAHWLPQSRPRVFVVGLRAAGSEAVGPRLPFHSARLVEAVERLPAEIRDVWAWWDLPSPARRNLDLAAILEPDADVRWLTAGQAERLLALLSPLHAERLAQAARSGERRVAAGYRRVRIEHGEKVQRLELRFDGLAGCLRTPAGGSSRQHLIVCEGGKVRARLLTAREAARLMGVPDSYALPTSETAALKLMGDAVAVPVVRALSEGLLSPALSGPPHKASQGAAGPSTDALRPARAHLRAGQRPS